MRIGRRLVHGMAIIAATALILGGSGSSVRGADQGFTEKFKAGDTAPEIVTTDLEGKKYVLSSYRGKKSIMLNFWGIRCGSCIEEMPYLEEMWVRYKDKDVVFLGVDTDGVNEEIITGALSDLSLKITYPLLLDLDFAITDAYTNFLVPLTIVIDKQGIIRYIHTGFEKGREKEYEDALKKVLG